MTVYFDNSATTRVSQAAAEKALWVMREGFGNPSSLHSMGFGAEKELNAARQAVAKALGAQPEEVVFTSGGTESNNLALLGGAEALKRKGSHIVTSAIEHPSVLEAMKQLEKTGFSVTYLKPASDGNLTPLQVSQAIRSDTVLVSLMSVNNETGACLPLHAVAPAIRKAGSPALFHVDNVQGFGKLGVPLKQLGADLMSVSGHKIHAPKGVGALFIKKGRRILPRVFGGGQEKKLRPGTENLPGIAALGVAAGALGHHTGEISALYQHLREGLSALPGVQINSPEDASPYILNFTAGPVRGETMMHFLAGKGVYLSTGSACAGSHASHVLTAMGLEKNRVESSLRLSLSGDNTQAEATVFLETLAEGLKTLAHP